uniref:Short neurotoxin 6 n=1 Tax=Pseudonaja textilis TaxID=8673 RepID=3S36_PSETE|nr:RecName: Full=Short neurotoxin 6; Short=SNTX6; AltName: Full=Alpha-neurotoxin 6; Flags: Precursor [Pseudonaja textilis]AAD40972.1 short neurotoxin precursor [Pseudonaja textilis]AAF75224.1 alpha neurotoxin [Pseudonaja textilis]
MKTLLLTLVMVTIMCLDLGYTLTCYKSLSGTVVCKPHETICYRRLIPATHGNAIIDRGCSTSCPGGNRPVCCSTDLCNK